MVTTLKIATGKTKEVIEIIDQVSSEVSKSKVKTGVCTLFVKHTTAALTTGEIGEGTDEDLMETLQKMIPKIAFRHLHNPEHTPDHMIASILGPSLSIPIVDGELSLGHWQRVLLVELNGPKEREVIVSIS